MRGKLLPVVDREPLVLVRLAQLVRGRHNVFVSYGEEDVVNG